MSVADKLLPHLSRRTTSGQFIAEIDGLRFASIALVVVFHLSGYTVGKSSAIQSGTLNDNLLARIAATGHYGVQLFFVISGFVLALPFARHYFDAAPAPRLRAYYLRRVTRLEPPYILAMLLVFVVASAFFGASSRYLWPHLLASLVYLHNLMYGVPSVVNVVAWSLEVEVQFYLLAPLLACVFAIRLKLGRRLVVFAGVAGAILLQRYEIQVDSRLSLTLLNYLQYFLLGFLLADFYLSEWRAPSPNQRVWDAVGVLSWIAMVAVWVNVPRPLVLFPLLALIVVCATFRGRRLRAVFRNPWVTTIGGMCYTIYLLHYPIISAIGRRTIRIAANDGFALHLLVQAAIVLPLLLFVSIVFFVAIERPCMQKDWPQRFAAAIRSASWARTRQWYRA
ncbi:MAG TPA: acyltransferase [Gemmatimonadaceae bacterium]|nr:acyltransferase [Gemmatimonadaceae bacterium]